MRIVMYILSVVFVGLYVGGTVYEVEMMKSIMDHGIGIIGVLSTVFGFVATVKDMSKAKKKKKKKKKKNK